MPHWFLYPVSSLFGLSAGSFAGAWVWRTRKGRTIAARRSVCDACRRILRWGEKIPIVSFFALRGRCRSCRERIPWWYPVLEAAMAALFVFAAWGHGAAVSGITPELVRDWAILVFLAAVFIYDALYGEIPDLYTVFPSVILAPLSLISGWHTASSLALGAAVGGGFFLLQHFVSRGRWVGGGDIRLGVFMGVILGWPRVALALFLAYVLGAAASVALIALKRKTIRDTAAFGTYLALATVIAMLWGEKIWQLYSVNFQ